MRRARHRLAHRLGWQHGRVVSRIDDHDRVEVAFQCDTCGEQTPWRLAFTVDRGPLCRACRRPIIASDDDALVCIQCHGRNRRT